MDNRTMTVTGTGTEARTPDYIEINMQLISTHYNYNETMKLASEKFNRLLFSLLRLGFTEEDLKTVSFSIQAEYKSRVGDDGVWVNDFIGYKCIQSLRLAFPLDLHLLNQVIDAIDNSGSVPDLVIQFTLENPDDLINESIKKAVQNAKEIAQLLAQSSGVQLGRIININYETNRVNIYSNSNFSVEYGKTFAPNRLFHITPEDIQITNSVNITWEIV